ncbi:hypothetical protein [Pyrobaculum sp.]|uniref:hypothetical protein n=1 Tax=Pyrobaculum sp. TaxID=2004705 RepID=UPI003164416F
MRLEQTPYLKLFCRCLRSEAALRRYAELLDMPPFLALGRIAVKIIVDQYTKNGDVVAITPHRVRSLVESCNGDRRHVRLVARAVKRYLRELGIFPVFNNYVYKLADLAKIH